MFKAGGYFYISNCFGLITILVFLWMGACSHAPFGIKYPGVARNTDVRTAVTQVCILQVRILAERLNDL